MAPTAYLKTFAANLAADGNQAVTLALYNANSEGPFGPAVWTEPATIDSTGSTGNYELQTFTVNEPLHPNQTYAFTIASGAVTANVLWALGSPSPGGACAPGPVIDRSVGQQNWLPPLANDAFSFKADFLTRRRPSRPRPPSRSPTRPSARSEMSRR